MKKEIFDELIESIKEGAQILKNGQKPSREFNLKKPDVKTIRKRYGLSQSKFAQLLGISTATLRNWEQGRRTPKGPARVLLLIAEKHPEAIWDSLYESSK